MLRRPKHSKIEVVAPKEEEDGGSDTHFIEHRDSQKENKRLRT